MAPSSGDLGNRKCVCVVHLHFSLSCIGEGNGNPLRCSCLENPRDGGAWWAAVYGVAQSWTRLKRLSSSSSSSLCVPLLATPWTVACQAPLSIGFFRQEYLSELPFPRPGDLPNPGIEPRFPEFPALAGRFFTTEPPEKPQCRGRAFNPWLQEYPTCLVALPNK